MFDFHSSTYNPNMITENSILMKDAEAGVSGELMIVSAGRLTKCTPLVTPYCILTKDTAAGVSVATEYLRVRKDNKYKCDVTGVGTPTSGVMTAAVSADGLSLDAANLATGKMEVVSYDSVGKKAIIMFT
jgi:hypothetical protein